MQDDRSKSIEHTSPDSPNAYVSMPPLPEFLRSVAPHCFPSDACCLKCRYSLRGLETFVCPECGTHFDPTNPDSFQSRTLDLERAADGRRRRAIPKPPTAGSTALVGVLAAMAIFAGSDVKWHVVLDVCHSGIVVFIIAALAIDYLMWIRNERFAVAEPNRLGASLFVESKSRRRWHGRLLTIAAVSVLIPWVLIIRFAVSWPWLHASAQDHLSGVDPSQNSRWIGLLHVSQISGAWSGAVFFKTATNETAIGIMYVGDNLSPDGTEYVRSFSKWPLLPPHWYVAAR